MTALSDLTVAMTKELHRAGDYLKAKHNLLVDFSCIEELVCDGRRIDEETGRWMGRDPDERPPLDERNRDGLTHNIGRICAPVARALWSEGYYVSTSLIDDFVLHARQAMGFGHCEPGHLRTRGRIPRSARIRPVSAFRPPDEAAAALSAG